MSALPIFLVSLTWNYGLGMTYVVVPLYAHWQGLTGVEIGSLFAIPVFFQVVFNLVGGAYTDRLGGRKIMLASCILMALGGFEFIVARGFWMLFVGQVLLVLARAAFWPATWALVSELPGARGVQMGRMNSLTNVGQIAGTASAGFILALAGFDATFFTLGAMGVLSLIVGSPAKQLPRKPVEPGSRLFGNYAPLLKRPVIWYTVTCAYLSALPFSLAMSFYPLLLKDFGFESQASGILIALRAVGAIAAGLFAARFVSTGATSWWPVVAGVAVALSVGLLPVVNHAIAISVLMFTVGFGAGVMTLYFQVTMTEFTGPAERGSAMGLGGFGWGFSHLSTPLAMGYLADHVGLVVGYYVLGMFAMGWTVMIAFMRSWAFAQPKPAM